MENLPEANEILGRHFNTKARQRPARSRLLSFCLQKIADARKWDRLKALEYPEVVITKLSSKGDMSYINGAARCDILADAVVADESWVRRQAATVLSI